MFEPISPLCYYPLASPNSYIKFNLLALPDVLRTSGTPG